MDLHRPQRSLRAASRWGITARHVHSFHALLPLPLFPLSPPLVLALTQLSTVSQSIADSLPQESGKLRRPCGTVKAAAAASRVASGKHRRMERRRPLSVAAEGGAFLLRRRIQAKFLLPLSLLSAPSGTLTHDVRERWGGGTQGDNVIF